MSDRRFAIPSRPERVYPAAGGMRYEGGSHFVLEPDGVRDLRGAVDEALADDRYVAGDWFDLPLPVYLVHDDEVGCGFKVAVGAEAVQLHVLPGTESTALEDFYEALRAVSDAEWSIRTVDPER